MDIHYYMGKYTISFFNLCSSLGTLRLILLYFTFYKGDKVGLNSCFSVEIWKFLNNS